MFRLFATLSIVGIVVMLLVSFADQTVAVYIMWMLFNIFLVSLFVFTGLITVFEERA